MAVKVLKELLVRFKGDTRSLTQATQNAERSVQGFENKTRKASTGVKTAFTGIARAVGTVAIAYGALQALNIADDFILLESRIKSATKNTAEFERALDGLTGVSKTTGAEFGATVSVFQRISFAREEIQATNEEMLQFTDTVSKLGVISGAGNASLSAGLTQLGQSLSSGVVRAEEFNSILENIPAVGKAIADQLGLTTGELRLLVVEGKIASKDVFEAILRSTKEANEEFEKLPPNLKRSLSGLKTTFAETLALLNKSTQATVGFASAVDKLAEALERFNERNKRYAETRALIESEHSAIANSADEAAIAIENMNKQMAGISKAAQGGQVGIFGSEGIEYVDEQVLKTREALREQVEVLKDKANQDKGAAKAQKEHEKAVKRYQKAMADAHKATVEYNNSLADFLIDSASGFQDWRSTVIGAVQDVLRNLLRLQLGGTTTGGFGGFIAQGISGLFGGTSLGTKALAAAGGSSMIGVKPAFASGGSFVVRGNSGTDRNMLSMNGQPIANVSKGETVAVNRAGMGETVINQNINVSTGVQQTVRAEVLRMLPQIKQASLQAVKESERRGK